MLATLELQEARVFKDMKGRWDLPVKMVSKVSRVIPEPMVNQVGMVSRVYKAMQGRMVLPASKVSRVYKAQPEKQPDKVHKVFKVFKV